MRRLLLLAAVMTACSRAPIPAPGADTNAPTAVTPNGTVVFVSDGDTVGVRVDGRTEDVRLIGIDTPETKDPRRPVACFGKEASAFTASLLPKGTPVRLERDIEPRDKYDRLLAYVYKADGTFVNLELARRGFADVLTIPPNVAHADELSAAVASARAGGRGLWGSCSGFGVPAG